MAETIPQARAQIESTLGLSASAVERFGLFTIIVLGEVIVGVVQGVTGHHELNWLIGATAALSMLTVLGNPEAIALAVQEGMGVGFVSNIVVDKLVLDGVSVVKVRGLELQRDIFIGRRASRAATAAQSAFWEFATGPGMMVEMEDPLPHQPLLVV